jgi:hypothetical protein
MKQIWLFVVAALFALTTTMAFAGQAMPAASGKIMEEQRDVPTRCPMRRSVAAVGILVLGILAWTPGRAAAQAHLLGRPWLNSPPLTLSALRGRVVLVDFWTLG